MPNNYQLRLIIFSVISFLAINSCFADNLPSAFSPIKTFKFDSVQSQKSEYNIDLDRHSENSVSVNLSSKDSFEKLVNATDRFVQCNIKASWGDFKNMIDKSPDNDFVYIVLANKMSDLGFFDLAILASTKVKDKAISNVSLDAMRRYYYPRRKLKIEDELFLAEVYSNIIFNNQSSEATNDLLNKENLLANSDYANYLVALGSYKSENSQRAAKYINIAILQNPQNLNYKRLKAEIMAGEGEAEEALKIVDSLKKQNLYSYEYERKINSLEQLILYKTRKAQWEKDYHLGYYYYLENDPSKSIRTLQSALSSKKRGNTGLIYGLMSEVYLTMNEYEKALDTAKKAYRINPGNPKALITLGDLCYREKNYKQALFYYKRACTKDKKSYVAFVKEAKTYQKLSNTKKAQEIYTKILKTHSDSWEAYYNVALLDNTKKMVYLKKAIAVNLLFEDGWIELAKSEIGNGNYTVAQKYLSNAFYIDENDYRYYYYQGLVDNNFGNCSLAKYNLKKCLKLNPQCKEAQGVLDEILNTEAIRQDSI